MEPLADDYVRYFDFLWEVKNAKSSNMWSTFSRLSETHRQKFGNDVQEVWDKIKQMVENKNEVLSDRASQPRCINEKSRGPSIKDVRTKGLEG